MDFGMLLHVAKKNNETVKKEGNFYCTKFAPPKRESKEKKLSDNIKKFLAKQENEERERKRAEKEKLANLLAMRDEKSKNKIRKMLKVTKSANKSVLDDVDNRNTAVTMQGPDQPDQDDYGYVSTEANRFYQSYMEKVKDVKDDKGFAPSRPQSLKDLSGTKERVKAAITKDIEDKNKQQRTSLGQSQSNSSTISGRESTTGHTRIAHGSNSNSSGSSSSNSKTLYDPDAERREEERKQREKNQLKLKNRKPPPPPMDFKALIKLAEQKQHEPIEILSEVKKKKEPERLLTMKERKELEERERAKEARLKRDKERMQMPIVGSPVGVKRTGSDRRETNTPTRMEPNGRIPKLNQTVKPIPAYTPTPMSSSPVAKTSGKATGISSNGIDRTLKKTLSSGSLSSYTPSSISVSSVSSSTSSPKSSLPSPVSSSKNPISNSALNNIKNSLKNNREIPPSDIKSSAMVKSRQFPPPDVQKTKRLLPPDVRRTGSVGNRPVANSSDSKKTSSSSATLKRRILEDNDDDEDDDYDSEMDDFIDDNNSEEDYSSHIKAIFGYDKSRYRDIDEGDDADMESNYAQVQREEYRSKKIGIQEDLEDMKLEAMEKKRKKMLKKQKMR